MVLDKISATSSLLQKASIDRGIGSFKTVLADKRASLNPKVTEIPSLNGNSTKGIKNLFTDMINHHENASKSIKTFMTRTDYRPDALLALQYKTGLFFLREQMFCKAAELSATTFKSFTQMQV